MKVLIGLLLSLFLLGCASTSDTSVNVGTTDKSGIVTLTDKCDAKCTAKIMSTFTFERSGSIFKKDAPVSYAILSAIDGQRGSNDYYDPSGSFNSTWDGGYQIQTSPGEKTIKMYPTAVHMSPNEETDIIFSAKPGQQYFVGKLFRRESSGSVQINYWSPVVMNINTYEILMPKVDVTWSKYCIAAREFSTSLPCPND